MKKNTYSAPVVEITAWDKADVITTSVVANDGNSSLDNANVTATFDFSTLQ